MKAVKRSARFEPIVRQLAVSTHPTAKRQIFPSMRELICFAAVLGFDRNSTRHLDEETEEIDGRIFEAHQQSTDLIYLIALAQSRDAEILRDENMDRAIGIFEQYADGGLSIIESWLKERADDEQGDVALLAALKKYGYLPAARTAAEAAADVSF